MREGDSAETPPNRQRNSRRSRSRGSSAPS
jgi:hypothetical protein